MSDIDFENLSDEIITELVNLRLKGLHIKNGNAPPPPILDENFNDKYLFYKIISPDEIEVTTNWLYIWKKNIPCHSFLKMLIHINNL